MSLTERMTLELVASLAQAISHRIRSPLSAISNDLFWLKARTKLPQLESLEESCQKITGILNEAIALGAEPLQLGKLSLRSFLGEIFGQASLSAAPGTFALGDQVIGDAGRLKTAFEAIRELLGRLADTKPRLEVVLAFKKFRLTIWLETELPSEVQDQPASGSLSHFFNWQLGWDSVSAILADAVFMAHGLDLHVDPKRGLKIQIDLQRNED